MHSWGTTVTNFGCRYFLRYLDVGACAYRDIQPSFESTQNKQQHGTKITYTEGRKISYGDEKCDIILFGCFEVLTSSLPHKKEMAVLENMDTLGLSMMMKMAADLKSKGKKPGSTCDLLGQ